MNYITSLLHRLLFIALIIPLGLCLVFEICIRFGIEIWKWVLVGRFSHDFMTDVYAYRIIEFLKFDKY